MPDNKDLNDVRGRRWMYGFNVAMLIVVGALIVGFALFMTSGVKKKWDMTSTGIYSLSGYTHQLLKQVDEKGQKYELVSLFPESSVDDRQKEKSTQVSDLLEEYARASNQVAWEELSEEGLDKLKQKIRDRYTAELKPYEAAVGEYRKVGDDLDKFCKTEAVNVGALAQQAGATPKVVQEAAELQNLFATGLPEILAENKRDINKYTDTTAPEWGKAVVALQSRLDNVEKPLALLASPEQVKEAVSPALATYFAGANDRYKAMDTEVKDYKAKLDKLAPLKVQEILDSLARNTIVVLGPRAASVVPEANIFKASRQEPAPGQPAAEAFEGEQAVSSALLASVQPEKVKVVFITTTAKHLATTPGDEGWTDMAENLKGANFEVLEWSPPSAQMNPDQQPSDPNPPAIGKGVVWIVFPPEGVDPQQAMMGMPPPSPQPVIDAVKKHMAAGGETLFLADAAGNDMFGSGGGYAYEELVKPFGVDVQTKYMAVHSYPAQGGATQVFPRIAVTHYKDQEIVKPLDSLQTIFMGFPNRQTGSMVGAPAVVDVAEKMPAGAEASVIVESPVDAETWGTSTFASDTTYNKGADRASPLPLGVAAVKHGATKEGDQRMVVLSSRNIGANYILEELAAASDDNGRYVAFYSNPGNSELVQNSVLWLAGYKNMIAVGSKAAAAMRIKDVSPMMMKTLWAVLVAGIPLLALVLGGVVWFVRRR